MSTQSTNPVKLVRVGMVTCVGIIGNPPYPRAGGNRFTAAAEGGRELKVLNMYHENLDELLRRGTVAFPLDAIDTGDGHCLICDMRIPVYWYSTAPIYPYNVAKLRDRFQGLVRKALLKDPHNPA